MNKSTEKHPIRTTYTKTAPINCTAKLFLDCLSYPLMLILILEVSNMALYSKSFPYEKSIVINALYDTIDALGLCLMSTNSTAGMLIVTDANQTGKLRLALGLGASTDQTRVEVFAEDTDSEFADTWRSVILDELTGMIKRCVTSRREKQQ
mgnify:CR=1 FL=1